MASLKSARGLAQPSPPLGPQASAARQPHGAAPKSGPVPVQAPGASVFAPESSTASAGGGTATPGAYTARTDAPGALRAPLDRTQGPHAAGPKVWQEARRVGGLVPVLEVDEREVEITAMRAQGAGGQNVNKVSSAIHLRFDVNLSSLPEGVKARLLALRDTRITQEGVVVIKAQQFRSQEQNRADALARLNALVNTVAAPPVVRRATKPTYGSKMRRLEGKSQRSDTKALRGKVRDGH